MNHELTASTGVFGGFRTRVHEAGPRDRPAVLLVHDGAYGTDAPLCWSALVPYLSDDYHVVAPDLLGWGGSDKVVYFDRSPYAFRWAHVLAVAAAVIGTARSVHVVGASFGGSLVLDGLPALRCGAIRCRSAVSIGGTKGRHKIEHVFSQLREFDHSRESAERITSLLVGSMDGLDDHVESRHQNGGIPGHLQAMQAGRIRGPSRRVETASDESQPAGIPLLFVEGDRDVLLEQGWSERMAFAYEGCSVAIPTGHEPNIDEPELLAQVLLPFLQSSG